MLPEGLPEDLPEEDLPESSSSTPLLQHSLRSFFVAPGRTPAHSNPPGIDQVPVTTVPRQYRLTCHRLNAGRQLAVLASDTRVGALSVDPSTADALTARLLWDGGDLDALCSRDGTFSIDTLQRNGLIEPFAIHPPSDQPVCAVVVTANRPRECARAVEFLIDDVASGCAGRPPILVVDDSSGEPGRRDLARRLDRVARRRQANIILFTVHAREHLVASIASADDAAAARFALLTARPGVSAAGAVRNFVNLLTSGHRVVSIDDDVAGPVLRSPRPGFAWADGSEGPAISPLFRSAPASWNSCRLMDSHLDFLGYRVGDQRSPILITAAGLMGDCGADGPWRELSENATQFPRPRLTRKVVRGVSQTTLTRADGLMTYAWGFANDRGLPPFMPIGRNQDGAFAGMLRLFRPDALTCHLPVYVTHRPGERRSERRYRDVAGALCRRWRTNDFITLLARSLPAPVDGNAAAGTVSDALTRVASRLGRGDLTPLSDVHVEYRRARLSSAQRWAIGTGWLERRRLTRVIEQCRTGQFTDSAVVPAEWGQGDVEDLSRYLQAAADVVARWDDVVAAVQRLARWARPWTQLGDADGVLHLGRA